MSHLMRKNPIVNLFEGDIYGSGLGYIARMVFTRYTIRSTLSLIKVVSLPLSGNKVPLFIFLPKSEGSPSDLK
jgi:hypothetical protein